MSNGLPSLARSIATAASRTTGCWALSAWEQRAIVRRASSAEIMPSWLSHSTSRRQSKGPRWVLLAGALGLATALMRGKSFFSGYGFEHPQPFAGRQVPASFNGFRAFGKRGTVGLLGRAQRQDDGVALARRLEGPHAFRPEGGANLLQALGVARR